MSIRQERTDLQEKVEIGLKASQKIIADTEAKLQKAIKHEDWLHAARLKSYINGMQQITAFFSLILTQKEN
jgi:hypothetical protein